MHIPHFRPQHASDLRDRIFSTRLTTHENIERGEVMLRPRVNRDMRPGEQHSPGLLALRDVDGSILFAHADLSGMSLFGVLAANRALRSRTSSLRIIFISFLLPFISG
ncbi:hypothetical protein [Paraburkholderia sediminicola]